MKKKLIAIAFALSLVSVAAQPLAAEGCFIDPDTGIETCPLPCVRIKVIDVPFNGFCEFWHYEDSCTGEIVGYAGFCN